MQTAIIIFTIAMIIVIAIILGSFRVLYKQTKKLQQTEPTKYYNIYRSPTSGNLYTGLPYFSLRHALDNVKPEDHTYIGTIKI